MPTIEEMNAWTPDEIRAEIHVMLPVGWRFEFLSEGEHFRAHLIGAAGEIAWWNAGADYQILLLDAYGWLWRQRQKTVNPIWKPRSRQRLVPVYKTSSQGETVPDPEDLDPSEISSVYSGTTKR